jgi:hypothetical protein
MSTRTMPAYTAEASVYRSNAHYKIHAMSTGFRQGGEIQLALRKIFGCGYKGCCWDLRDVGGPRVCCNRSGESCESF